MTKAGILLTFATFAILLNCDGHDDSANISAAIPPVEDAPDYSIVKTLDGAAIYSENCARCHGDRGEGTKKDVSLTSSHAWRHWIDEYIEQINNGATNKMPAFRGKLSLEEITSVANHIYYDLQGAP